MYESGMEVPHPPRDVELRNIIDKLAQFVARNGPEFEQMTKVKQQGNPKFSFLFGGENYSYYAFKVNNERAILKNNLEGYDKDWNSSPGRHLRPLMDIPSGLLPLPPSSSSSLSKLKEELSSQQIRKNELKNQITQSESNLKAQEDVTESQIGLVTQETLQTAQYERLELLGSDTGISIDQMAIVFQPIIESCTKDSISSGKSWIFNNGTTKDGCNLIAQYLRYRVTKPDSSFSVKLHLTYLLNDVLHHCVRKNADVLRESLEKVAVEMFSAAAISADDDKKSKLDKLLTLWESKSIFTHSTLSKMKRPKESWIAYESQLINDYKTEIQAATVPLRKTVDNYKNQHLNFVSHANTNIMSIDNRIKELEDSIRKTEAPPHWVSSPNRSNGNNRSSRWDSEENWAQNEFPPDLPDLSRPPPGFQKPPPSNHLISAVEEEGIKPKNPYYDLPAGLLIPLIKLDDFGYKKPIDPTDIRLPPPVPPSERLIAALDAFYSPPSHERPRDPEGFEVLGLFEYNKEKQQAIARKKKEIENGTRVATPPPVTPEWARPSPEKYTAPEPRPEIKKRVYRSRSRTKSRESTPDRRRSVSPKSPYSRSRSNRSPSPKANDNRKSGRRRRSPSPLRDEAFVGFGGGDSKIDSSNKGHQMMQKMGWRGSGLGSEEKGMTEPISGGEIRDNKEKYKGVGVPSSRSDPFEAFRKNKAGSFYHRMRERDARKQ